MSYKEEDLEKKPSAKSQAHCPQDPLAQYPEVKEQWDRKHSAEEKITFAISVMKDALSQKNTPLFKKFWDIRKLSIPLFKETMDASSRATLWEKFMDLSTEARALKSLLDEKSLFTSEQIGLAIEAIEKDVENYAALLKGAKKVVLPSIDGDNYPVYQEKQTELHLLNTIASRIASLRKELMQNVLRMKQKNMLFKRLSGIANTVFPKRKTLMEEVSSMFCEDVQTFVEAYFKKDNKDNKVALYVLKEKIKQLQGFARHLSLTSAAFSNTRNQLSACWDEVKVKEKKRKERLQERLQHSKEKTDTLLAKIVLLQEQKKDISSKELSRQLEGLRKEIKLARLGKEDMEKIEEALEPFEETSSSMKKEPTGLESVAKSFGQKLEKILQEKQTLSLDDVYDRFEQLERQIDKAQTSYKEKTQLHASLLPLRNWIDSSLVTQIEQLLGQDAPALENCRDLLALGKKIRMKVKQQLEELRKKKGRCGFDFEMAMNYQENFDAEKERVEKIDISIEKLEERIENIESR